MGSVISLLVPMRAKQRKESHRRVMTYCRFIVAVLFEGHVYGHPGHYGWGCEEGLLVGVEAWGVDAIGGVDAEAVEYGGVSLGVVAEVFGSHAQGHIVDVVVAEELGGEGARLCGEGFIVHDAWVAVAYLDIGLRAVHSRDALGDCDDALFHLGAPFLVHGAHGAGYIYLVGDDVGGTIGHEFTEGEHEGDCGRHFAGDEMLHGDDGLAGCEDGVGEEVWHTAVAAVAFDVDVYFVARGHVHARAEANVAYGHLGEYVCAEDEFGFSAEGGQGALGEHKAGATWPRLLAWLEDEDVGAVDAVA